jgi:hypothetical protein
MFTPTFHLLQQECTLLESCIYSGLSALSKAHTSDKGQYYVSFFNLSVGLERLMKLVLILDSLSKSNKLTTVKNFSHDLEKLFAEAKKISSQHNFAHLSATLNDPIRASILKLLSDFALKTRYANLDRLNGVTISDPLQELSAVLKLVLASEVSVKFKNKIQQQASLMTQMMAGHSTVIMSDLNQNPMSLHEVLATPALNKAAGKYIVWHLLQIINDVRSLAIDISHKATGYQQSNSGSRAAVFIPAISDFLTVVGMPKAHALTKRRWP